MYQLTVGDIKEQINAPRFFWAGNRQKTVVPFKTFIGAEAFAMIKRYLKEERADAEDNEPLFVKRNGDIQPMDSHLLGMNFKKAAEDMGVTTKGRSQNPLRPKRLRKTFRTLCDAAGIERGYVHVFMGHQTSISGEYLEKTPQLQDSIPEVRAVHLCHKRSAI